VRKTAFRPLRTELEKTLHDMSMTGKTLADEWGIPCEKAYYNKNGKWFHCLKHFPGALLDEKGFKLFETKKEYDECKELKNDYDVSNGYGHCTVKKGISNISGYTRIKDTIEDFQAQLDCAKVMIASLESRLQSMGGVDL
jgi:hypothetical protein